MKKLLTLTLVLTGLYSLQGQGSAQNKGFGFEIDHYSIVVMDLPNTGDFYRDVVGLAEIPHPDRDPRFRWFSLGGHSQVHLIQKEVAGFTRDKSVHLCLNTQDLQGFMAHLKDKGVEFYDWPGKRNAVTHRSDGVDQIYIQDPEGSWIEINDRKI